VNQQIVCDRCRVRLVLGPSGSLAQFVTEHEGHNFTGLRVVPLDNPCPNRARNYTLVGGQLGDPPDIETLAAKEHSSWSAWADYELDAIEEELGDHPDRATFKDLKCVQRWRRQITLNYEKLTEKEKESDRRVVREKLPVYRPCFK